MDNRYEYRQGQFVSQRVAQVVEAIREYCPEIEVQWVPQAQRGADTAAFRLIHHPANGPSYTIFHVKDEQEFDARVLKRLMLGDQRHGETLSINEIEAAEAAAKAVARQRFLDEMEEANEMAAAVLKSPKSSYKINDDLTIHDYGNRRRR